MQLQRPFDATQWNPTQSAGQLPVGKHPVVISDSTVKATKDNSGGYVEFTLQITDGPQTGCTGPYRLNLYNQSQQAVEIAHKQLSAICHVVGIFNVQDTQQLHGRPFLVEVAPQKGDPQYTEVKRVFDINGNEPGKQNTAPAAAPVQQQPQQPQGFQTQQQPQQAPPTAAPPWGQAPANQAPAPQQPQQAPPAAAPWGNPPAAAPQQQPQGQAPANPAGGFGTPPWGQQG